MFFFSIGSAILVADGTMSIGQGLLSVGQSAASAYIGYAAGGMTAAGNSFGTQFAGHALQSFGGAAISNFSLSDNGNFHFDTAKFITSGIAGTAGGAIVGNGNNPLTGAAIKGAFNTAGDIAYNRYNNGNYDGWQDTVKVGAITAGAGYLSSKVIGATMPGADKQTGQDNWQYSRMLAGNYLSYGLELGIGNMTGTNVRAETWDSLSSVNSWELVMKDMKLPGIKNPEDGKSANTGNKKQSDGFFADIWNDMTGFAGDVGNFGKTLVDGVKDTAKGVKDFAESLTNYMVGSKIWETGAERTKREATDVLAKARAQMLIDFTGDKRSETNQKLANIMAFGAKYGVDVDFIEAEVRKMQADHDEKQKNREIDARAEQFAAGIDPSNPLAYQQVLGREFAEKYQDQDNVSLDTTKPLFTDHHDYLQNTGVFDDWLNVNLDNDSTQYLDHVDYGFEYNYGVEKHKYDSQRYLDYVDPLKNTLVERVISAGENWIGTSYKLGGNSKNGIDCTHFVNKAYTEGGMLYEFQPSATFDTIRDFEEISKSQLQRGDTIVWQAIKNDGMDTYTGHGAIYTAEGGNRDILHSYASNGVGYTSNYVDNYYKNSTYKGGSRDGQKRFKSVRIRYFRYKQRRGNYEN